MSRALCKTCKAPVVWVTTEKGFAMPVDARASGLPGRAEPVRGGNIRLEGATAVYVQPLLETEQQKAAPHYVSHFATCPDAKQHRKAAR